MNVGMPIGPGFINITGEYRDRDNTNRADTLRSAAQLHSADLVNL